jgi:hypothetical protein
MLSVEATKYHFTVFGLTTQEFKPTRPYRSSNPQDHTGVQTDKTIQEFKPTRPYRSSNPQDHTGVQTHKTIQEFKPTMYST